MLFIRRALEQECLSFNNGIMRLCRTYFVRVSIFFPKRHGSSAFESPENLNPSKYFPFAGATYAKDYYYSITTKKHYEKLK